MNAKFILSPVANVLKQQIQLIKIDIILQSTICVEVIKTHKNNDRMIIRQTMNLYRK
jgi:hypothetical protein